MRFWIILSTVSIGLFMVIFVLGMALIGAVDLLPSPSAEVPRTVATEQTSGQAEGEKAATPATETAAPQVTSEQVKEVPQQQPTPETRVEPSTDHVAAPAQIANPAPPTAGQSTANFTVIKYKLEKNTMAHLIGIMDQNSKLVRVLPVYGGRPAGKYSVLWDQLDNKGRAVAAADYKVMVVSFQPVTPVLVFHDLSPDGAANPYSETPEAFQRQMRYLDNAGYQTLTFKEYADLLKKGKPIPANAALIAFEDGYESFYKYALPVLKDLKVKASVFLTPGVGPDAKPRLTADQVKALSSGKLVDVEIGQSELHRLSVSDNDGRLKRIMVNSNLSIKDLAALLVTNPLETLVFETTAPAM